jgi:glycosyltransferase involved in cell wall biosynthesis
LFFTPNKNKVKSANFYKEKKTMPHSQEQQCELTIVMPCLNEAETLETCILKAQRYLRENKVNGEIVIADNGSADGSQEIALKLGVKVINVETKGYGAALLGGINAACGKYTIMGDADDSYDFSNLNPFLEKLRLGYDLVMGNRFKGGIKAGAMPPLHKYLGNPVLTGIGRILFNSRSGDFHCGLRGFNTEAIKNLDLKTTGMEFASEMVVKSTLSNVKIAEVPTTLSPDGRNRPPHLRSWRDGWRHLRFMLLYSPKWLFFYPGLLLILAGLAAGLWLLPGSRTVGQVTFDVHTLMFGGAAVLIGFQSVIFAVFTKIFAITEGLLPEDTRLKKVFDYINLEVGLIFGMALFLAGLGGAVYALVYWDLHLFGPLNVSDTMRIVIPSVTLLSLGCQIILSSFFLSILGLSRR